MTGLCISRWSGQFIAVDSQAKCVCHYNLTGGNYRFHLLTTYGQGNLSEPIDVTQLQDGRVVVTDGKAGHSIKVSMYKCTNGYEYACT